MGLTWVILSLTDLTERAIVPLAPRQTSSLRRDSGAADGWLAWRRGGGPSFYVV
jgi:hypothetical protein